MLSLLRKRENIKRVMWLLTILIIPAFVLWGPGSSVRSRGLPKYAGKIFGKKVSFKEYEQSLRACRTRALFIYGDEFNKLADSLNLQQEAWEQLILLYQAAKEKIKVADKEVVNLIQKIPLFQKNGRFHRDTYNILIASVLRASPREFEEQIRQMLKMEKLKNKLVLRVGLTDEEIRETYEKENKKATAFYVFVDPQEFSEQINPAYEKLQDYYQEHKGEFEKPDQVNVQYIGLYLDEVHPEVSEAEIQNYYQKNPQQFSIKDKKEKETLMPLEEVKEQIRKTLTQNKAKALLEDKIWEIFDRVGESPASFEEIAKNNQSEVKETGFFAPAQVIPDIGLSYDFSTAAFSLKNTEISNPIETPKGYFIIKAKEKKQAYIPLLEEIKKELTQAVIKEKSWKQAKNKGEQLLSQISQTMRDEKLDFAQAAEKLSLQLKQTEEFTMSSYISGIGQSREFTQAAFALKPGELSNLISVPNGYCILSLKDIIPIDEEKFDQEKEEFAQKVLARKREVFYQMWVARLAKEANLQDNIAKLNADSGN